ncbi:MAG: serine/threonine protein kinase [Polyangiaceae bacterium]|nr:serine/threonine protein kinase [Polyangiaceae bacterium]
MNDLAERATVPGGVRAKRSGRATIMSIGVNEGEIIAGKYRVERVLGSGAMGVVVAATHLGLRQPVAIKLMLNASLARPDLVARFSREARAAATIKSEHVARVIDVGELDGGAPFIVMELLEGEDLAGLLLRRGPLPPAEAVGYVLEACDAIAEAHAAGIIHRDLKPANLFLTSRPDGTPLVKVLDFGISKISADADGGAPLTVTRAIMGSPVYMPPEQLRSSRDVDVRSDIWSLGVILYELVSGRTPFRGRDLPELAIQIFQGELKPTGSPDVPPGLEAVLERCLQRHREDRFADLGHLVTALAPFGPPAGVALAERVVRLLHGSMHVKIAGPLPRPELGSAPALHPELGSAPALRPEPGSAPALRTPSAFPAPPAFSPPTPARPVQALAAQGQPAGPPSAARTPLRTIGAIALASLGALALGFFVARQLTPSGPPKHLTGSSVDAKRPHSSPPPPSASATATPPHEAPAKRDAP